MKHNQDVEYNFCTFAIDKLLILNPSLLIFTNVLYECLIHRCSAQKWIYFAASSFSSWLFLGTLSLMNK